MNMFCRQGQETSIAQGCLDIAWSDQKAIGIILSLGALGMRGIRIGPTLPAFLQSDGGRRFMKK